LIRAWKEKGKIFQGIRNQIFKSADIEDVANERLAICRTNVCGYHDPKGEAEVSISGLESCGGCGCSLAIKTRSLSSFCYLKEKDKEPLWDSEMTEQEELLLEATLKKQDNDKI
jgi:hypothetical protein